MLLGDDRVLLARTEWQPQRAQPFALGGLPLERAAAMPVADMRSAALSGDLARPPTLWRRARNPRDDRFPTDLARLKVDKDSIAL